MKLKHEDPEQYVTTVELLVETSTRLQMAIDQLKPVTMRLDTLRLTSLKLRVESALQEIRAVEIDVRQERIRLA